jgi:hypothetical protein
LLVRFLSASSAVAVFGFFLLWKGRLKTSPPFSSSLFFSQAKKLCNGLVWANRLLPGGGVIFCFRVLPLQQSGISLSLSLSLSCYAESQGDETLALGDGTSLPLAMKLLFQRI